MAEIEFAFKKHYSSFFSTFKQTSLDDNDWEDDGFFDEPKKVIKDETLAQANEPQEVTLKKKKKKKPKNIDTNREEDTTDV